MSEKRDTQLEHLHPEFRFKVLAVLQNLQEDGIPFRVFEGFRSPQRQSYLYSQGRTAPGPIVTKAQAWQSFHQYGLAVDFALYLDGRWSWANSTPTEKQYWRRLQEIGRRHGLSPLSWELPHLEFAHLSIGDLIAGHFPSGGDDVWSHCLLDAIESWHGVPASPPHSSLVVARPPLMAEIPITTTVALPPLGKAGWHNRHEGHSWRYDEHGVYLRHSDASGDDKGTLLRSPGNPVTCQAIWKLFGPIILEMAGRFGVPPELIIMTIATETASARRDGFTGPQTFRWEANVTVDDVTPSFRGDYSIGPMQTLATTARWVIKTQKLPLDAFQVAPVIKTKPLSAPSQHPLYQPELNLLVGTAEIKQRWDTTGADPILVAAAFNSGGVYQSVRNAWHLSSYGDHLDRAAAWYGDACAVLHDVGVRP